MASVDLKDAFYSIPVNKTNQKYFKFQWEGHYFQFSGMPNGYGPAMRIFTKQLKPVNWWLQNIPNTTNFIHAPDIDCVIYTDASNLGWGATHGKTPTGGRWNSKEVDHINKRELLVIKLALLAYCREEKYKHVRIHGRYEIYSV